MKSFFLKQIKKEKKKIYYNCGKIQLINKASFANNYLKKWP